MVQVVQRRRLQYVPDGVQAELEVRADESQIGKAQTNAARAIAARAVIQRKPIPFTTDRGPPSTCVPRSHVLQLRREFVE